MPKMKSHRGCSKRFTFTASGKLKRRKQNKRHILTKKAQDRKRRLRKPTVVDKADMKRIVPLVSK